MADLPFYDWFDVRQLALIPSDSIRLSTIILTTARETCDFCSLWLTMLHQPPSPPNTLTHHYPPSPPPWLAQRIRLHPASISGSALLPSSEDTAHACMPSHQTQASLAFKGRSNSNGVFLVTLLHVSQWSRRYIDAYWFLVAVALE